MTSRREVAKRNEDGEFLPNTLESAAQEAAMADGLIPGDPAEMKLKKAGLRRGKWTTEEESYANRLIYEFKLGLLPLTDGTTLRTFLSKLLNCDPMRISKKFVGQNCIGKQVFRRRQQDLEMLTPDQIETSRKELAELERKFLERVAQTNRSKTAGVKEGKGGYEDENGNPIMAPWMVPPDDSGELSARAAHHLANRGSQGTFPSDHSTYSNGQSGQMGYPHQKMLYAGHPDMPGMDYHHMFNANNAVLMSHIMQSGGVAPFPYMPGYTVPHHLLRPAEYNSLDGKDGVSSSGDQQAQQQMQYDLMFQHLDPRIHQQVMENLQRNGIPYPAWPMTPAGAPSSSDGAQQNTNLAFPIPGPVAGIGSSQEWPSMGSLFGAGESMENIAQFLAHYQSQNSESALQLQEAEAGVDGGEKVEKEPMSASKFKSTEDVGLSIDDGSSTKNTPFGKGSEKKMVSGKWQDRVPTALGVASSSSKAEPVRYSLPPDTMTAVAQMYSDGSGEYARSTPKVFPVVKSEKTKAEGAATSSDGQVPRNSSVDNFWMLVNMGDLPRPDQDVLSEVVFDYPKTASRSQLAVKTENGGSAIAGTNGEVKSEVSVIPGDATSSSFATQSALNGHADHHNHRTESSPANDAHYIGKKRLDMNDGDSAGEAYGLSLEDERQDAERNSDHNGGSSPVLKKAKVEER